jgi:hypothetical protein
MSMKQDAFDSSNVEEEEQRIALQNSTTEPSSPASAFKEAACEALSVQVLAAECMREIDNYRRGEPWTEEYGLELLRRATVHRDQEAWTGLQHCYGGLVRSWLRRHPKREIAYLLESDENFVAQTFERFWQATTLTQRVEFNTLAAALQYLRASLNGVILDTLRTYARPGEITLPEPGEIVEPYTEDKTDSSEVWETLQTMLSNEREQRLAYLLFHCGLSPKDIVYSYSQEFHDVREISHLRHSIFEQLLHCVDHFEG